MPLAASQIDPPSPSPALPFDFGGMNATPSASSNARCASGPPNANPGANEPSRNTTRWHGITPCSGLPCSAYPTSLAQRGAPISAATCPYVATMPRGITRTTAYTRSLNDSSSAILPLCSRQSATQRSKSPAKTPAQAANHPRLPPCETSHPLCDNNKYESEALGRYV